MKIVRNVTDAEIKSFRCCAVDTEWTKNYKIKNGNKPFLFSVLFYNNINIEDVLKEQLDFKFVSVYIDNENEIPELINLLNRYLDCKNLKLLVGHQVISDLYTFVHFSENLKGANTSNLAEWIGFFKDRANNGRIFDTRFDLKNWLVGKSRRLVDVCYEMKIKNQLDLHKQPELNKSMTALQKEFMQTKNSDISERLRSEERRVGKECM